MAREILIDVGIGETRIALIDGDRLSDISIERPKRQSLIGSIWLGRVIRVVPGMQAAFIDLGLSRAGFLAARDARVLAGVTGSDEPIPIGTLLHEGQAVIVEVSKDPLGEKGVKLSAEATVPGRYLVYSPYGAGIHLSRRIETAAERERLSAALDGLLGAADGFIVRTAAIGAAGEALREEAVRLRIAWSEIVARAGQVKPPARLWRDLDVVERMLRDHLTGETERVRINSRPAFAVAKKYAESELPQLAARIELHAGQVALFDLYGVEAEIARALQKRVALPCGGAITIEATQALTAIDVDSGSFLAGRGLEETSLRTNLEAAGEIARQLRLRGIGGIIVIDFIHLEEAANREAVLEALRTALAGDRAPTRVLGMSEFGLVELTRKRTGEPLAHAASAACTGCAGEGRVSSTEAVAAELARRAEREAATAPGRPLTLVVAAEIAEALQAWDCADRLAEQAGVAVEIRVEANRRADDCDVLVG